MRQMRGAYQATGGPLSQKASPHNENGDYPLALCSLLVEELPTRACANGDLIEIRHGNLSHTSQTMLFRTYFLAISIDKLCDLHNVHRGNRTIHVTTLEL